MTKTPNEKGPAVIQSKKRFSKRPLHGPHNMLNKWRMDDNLRGLMEKIQRKGKGRRREVHNILSDDLKFKKQIFIKQLWENWIIHYSLCNLVFFSFLT